MGLEVNLEKTPLVQQGTSRDFLGYAFRYDRSRPQWGRHQYLNGSSSTLERKRKL
jgi:hypothetical protein